jgi:hypothetical protein
MINTIIKKAIYDYKLRKELLEDPVGVCNKLGISIDINIVSINPLIKYKDNLQQGAFRP